MEIPSIKKFDIRTFVILFLLLIGAGCSHSAPKNIKDATFERISEVRKEKKAEVISYFQEVRDKAHTVTSDKKMMNLYEGINASPTLAKLKKLTFEMDVHFVTEYSDFYDILFVDESGYIFHSVKQEADYQTNLFEGRWAGSHLARKLKNNAGEQFVDYDYYGPSDEAAAFFVAPINDGSKRSGWIILQTAINRVNTIRSNHDALGRTGEVYLVNMKKMMLTDSRFLADSTILKQKVETDAVRLAFKKNEGRELIEDYRSVRVFSAFEKFDIFNNSWIIIVEIDEDEIITEHYKGYKKDYLGGLMKEVMERKGADNRVSPRWQGTKQAKRVDISEFSIARSGEVLETRA